MSWLCESPHLLDIFYFLILFIYLQLQLSEVLTRLRQFYDLISRDSGSYGEGMSGINQKDFERYLKMCQIDRESRKKWFTILDVGKDG